MAEVINGIAFACTAVGSFIESESSFSIKVGLMLNSENVMEVL